MLESKQLDRDEVAGPPETSGRWPGAEGSRFYVLSELIVMSRSSTQIAMPAKKLSPYHPSQPEPDIPPFDISAIADVEHDKPSGDDERLPTVSFMSVSRNGGAKDLRIGAQGSQRQVCGISTSYLGMLDIWVRDICRR